MGRMTRFLLRHRLSSTLPRKFKIAFEGCAEDHIATSINDMGFRGRIGPHPVITATNFISYN